MVAHSDSDSSVDARKVPAILYIVRVYTIASASPLTFVGIILFQDIDFRDDLSSEQLVKDVQDRQGERRAS